MSNSAKAAALRVLLICGSGLLSSCTTVSTLRSSTLEQGMTSIDIVNKMVLDNLAMAETEEYALPWHIKLTQGAIDINDSVNPSASVTWHSISRTVGVDATRSWDVSWTVVPEFDHQKLTNLRELYHRKTHPTLDASLGLGCNYPSGAMHGQYKNTCIYVLSEKQKDFGDLVLEVLSQAPITDSERGIQLPGGRH